MSAISELDNPVTNGASEDSEIVHDQGKTEKQGWLSKIGQWLVDGGVEGAHAIAGASKYIGDTAYADKNSVPLNVRLAVAAAGTPQDKLDTFKQWYPDATINQDRDIEFMDPKYGHKMTLDDPGLSIGDLVNAIPSIGQGAGQGLGTAGGATLGSFGGPVGTVAGGVAGGAIGSAGGKELTTQALQKLVPYLTGKDAIDTRSGSDIASQAGKNALLGGVTSALPLGYAAGKAALTSDLLTPESGTLYDTFASQGFKPSLSQVGSAAGKKVEQGIISQGANAATQRAMDNTDVLNNNVTQFMGGDIPDQNELANMFRSGQQGTIGGLHQTAQDAYAALPFSANVIPPAAPTKAALGNLIQNEGKNFIPDPQGLIPKVMNGTASELDLQQLQQNITKQIADGRGTYSGQEALKGLKSTITDDLTAGNPNLTADELGARQSWANFKNSQEDLTDLLGKQSGVTGGVDPTQGLTETQSLNKGKAFFNQGAAGSDQKAQQLAANSTPQDKQTLLASILTESQPEKSMVNPMEAATQKYNMDRVGQYLTNPEDQQALQGLAQQSQGTTAVPPWVSPSNFSSMRHLPSVMQNRMALGMASRGEVPGNMPVLSSGTVPGVVGSTTAMATPAMINANAKTPSWQYPGMGASDNMQISTNLDDYLRPADSTIKPNYLANLDDYLRAPGTPSTKNSPIQFGDQITAAGVPPMSKLGYQASGPQSLLDLNPPPQAPAAPATQAATPADVWAYINQQKQNTQTAKNASGDDLLAQALDATAKNKVDWSKKSTFDIQKEAGIPAPTRALLNTIASPGLEGGGYHTIVGGGQFNDFSQHPNIVGVVTPRGASTAAGKYQDLHSTWTGLQNKYPDQLPDFSPLSQEKGGALLANDNYTSRTGRDLNSDLSSGDPALINNVAHALNPTWTSLPGGIEQGSGAGSFGQRFQSNLAKENLLDSNDQVGQFLQNIGGSNSQGNSGDASNIQPVNMNQAQTPDMTQAQS